MKRQMLLLIGVICAALGTAFAGGPGFAQEAAAEADPAANLEYACG